MDVLFDDRVRGAAAAGPQWARRWLLAAVQPAILARVQPRRHPHERVADGHLQQPAAAVSVQGGAADHVLEAHVPGCGTDMEVGLGGVLVSRPEMKVDIGGVLVGRPASSVSVPLSAGGGSVVVVLQVVAGLDADASGLSPWPHPSM